MCVGHVLEMLGTCFGPVSTIAIAGVNVNFCHALSESCSVLLTFDNLLILLDTFVPFLYASGRLLPLHCGVPQW